ncbi:squalene--hopene cyclase [Shouchella lehensis]|uniref:Squalene--hopene cyclase n=1 Tax=Shouchella lehensis G1 TaxID=1246626 RepID=A0A060M1B6_9BACI|nr:squalene--hopene cyclase [Shouchella lehensis]AIC96217.1 Squalene--hopene cyclase [Shouchella lehensis G1]
MKIQAAIDTLVSKLREDQLEDGSWQYPFEAGTFTDAYMIILLRTLEKDDETLIQALAERLLSLQEENGAWKLVKDENEGNLTTTVECYYALLYSGYLSKNDQRLQKAKQFILTNGGIEQTTLLTKFVLLLTGQYKWPSFFPVPIELILLPVAFPFNLFSMSVYGRAHMVPLLIAADHKLQVTTSRSPDLSDLYSQSRNDPFLDWVDGEASRKLHGTIHYLVKKVIPGPTNIHQLAISQAKRYMMNATEQDGTLFSYFTSTMFMVFALLALGHPKHDPLIEKAMEGLKSFQTTVNGKPHIQFTTATIWNTSLISYALQEAKVKPSDEMIQKASSYLVQKQHNTYGDWIVHNPGILPGGWGFSTINSIQPDMDDTTSSLRAITAQAVENEEIKEAWKRGTLWVTSMQNRDGGWGAFEKNTNSRLLALLPIQESKGILTDPSTPDLTGRVIEFLGNFTHVPKDEKVLKRGIRWLKRNQQKDGSWEGQWGVNYIYGTWAALTALDAAGVSKDEPHIRKAVNWLKSIQHQDGGWGESCLSDRNKKFTKLPASNLTQTAWAIDALIATLDYPEKSIRDGVRYLLAHLHTSSDWTNAYPVGKGLADRIYFHYHSYRYFYPLLALAHYQNKYNQS